MKITLHHVQNVDLSERGGYWSDPVDPSRLTVECATLRDCSAALVAWRDRNGLGAGNLGADCGSVRDEKGKVIAEISYNGRAWKPGEVAREEIPLT